MNKKIIVGSLVGCIFGATVGYSASVVSLPHTFAAGTPIKASEVNANFAALGQEIASVKGMDGLSKSSDFSEKAITPIVSAVGSIITVGSKNYVIKQKAGIEDPITGKKYTLNYPEPTTGSENSAVFYISNCRVFFDTNIAVRLGHGNGFTSYVAYHSSSNGARSSTSILIQVNNICTHIRTDIATETTTYATVSAMIDRTTELQKYISVQEI